MQSDNRMPINGRPKMSSNDQEILRSRLFDFGVLNEFYDSASPLETSILSSATSLYEFFHSNGYMIRRSEWELKGIYPGPRSYRGWVYAFYGEQDSPIYVGETGQQFTKRFNQHKKQLWWQGWERVKVLPCPNQTMRKVFESLIGLAGGYSANIMQPTGEDNILNDVILSLILLGNETCAKPTFPNQMILDQANQLQYEVEALGSLDKSSGN
ncbi:hypothetical protein AAKU64_000024 [Undibacterium sp. GrIS 1.8]|uniref:GIY-YIG nuclease family protein n=1 Tax=unclassified Undibacterium TaxID=2630295 RepID=UPI0033926C84